MAHIKCPIDYIPLQQVTAANLNAHVNNAQLQPGAISDHTALPDPLASGDQFLVNDVSATPDELRSITAAAIFSSDLPVTTSNLTTSTITGKAGANINVTAPAGYNVNIPSPITTTGVAVTGNGSVSGTLTVTSGIVTGDISSTGTANFTGALQVNGTVGYALTEIIEANISYTGTPAAGTWTNCFTSASYTKPAGEIWVIEVDFRFRTQAQVYTVIRLNQTSSSTTLNGVYNIEGGGTDYFHCENAFLRYVFQDATTFTSTFTLDVQPSNSGFTFTIGEASFPYTPPYFTGVTLPVSKFRIYKYKTA